MQTFVINTGTYNIRREDHQGKPHIIVPVVMMVEGVHSGNHGPIFHSAVELGKFPEAWNGIPAVIQHPAIEGQNVSANSPEMIDSEAVGRVYNTQMDGDKLKAEVWIDEEKLRTEHPEVLAHINNGIPLDVSVGVFSEEENTQGDWNGETYNAVARNLRPDHLALFLEGLVHVLGMMDVVFVQTRKEKNLKKI